MTKKVLMSKRLTNIEFINKSKIVHKETYDYSLVNYINNHTNVTIICLIHGEFEQIPSTHMIGRGCPRCGVENSRIIRAKNQEDFLEEPIKIHNKKYDYSETIYKTGKTKIIIICKLHGKFEQKAGLHVRGYGCPACAEISRRDKRRKSLDYFIENAKKVHGNLYDYSKSIYLRNHRDIEIICNKHGSFFMSPANHYAGQNCPICAAESRGSYSRSRWIKGAKGRKGILYIIKCYTRDEYFYKVGITFNNIEIRYGNKKREMPYKYKTIYTQSSDNLTYIWDKETFLKKIIRDNCYYKPEIDFSGSLTECFSDIELIMKSIKEYDLRGNEDTSGKRPEEVIL